MDSSMPGSVASSGEDTAFREQQAHDLCAAGAEGEAQGDLALPADGSGQQQAGHVRARAQQHQSEQHEQDGWHEELFGRSGQLAPAQRGDARGLSHACVLVGIGLLESPAERGHSGERLPLAYARTQPSEHGQRVPVVPVADRGQHQPADWNVDVGVLEHGDRANLGQHADDGERLPVDHHLLTDDAAISTEPPCPEWVAEHDHSRLPFRHRLGLAEEAARSGWNAEELEEVRGDGDRIERLWRVAAPPNQWHASRPGNRLEEAAVAEVTVVQVRELIAVAGLHGHDAGRVGHRRLVEEGGFDDGKERQVDADAETETEDADRDDPGAGAEGADRVSNIGDQAAHIGSGLGPNVQVAFPRLATPVSV